MQRMEVAKGLTLLVEAQQKTNELLQQLLDELKEQRDARTG